jgi:hypothetical protein
MLAQFPSPSWAILGNVQSNGTTYTRKFGAILSQVGVDRQIRGVCHRARDRHAQAQRTRHRTPRGPGSPADHRCARSRSSPAVIIGEADRTQSTGDDTPPVAAPRRRTGPNVAVVSRPASRPLRHRPAQPRPDYGMAGGHGDRPTDQSPRSLTAIVSHGWTHPENGFGGRRIGACVRQQSSPGGTAGGAPPYSR